MIKLTRKQKDILDYATKDIERGKRVNKVDYIR